MRAWWWSYVAYMSRPIPDFIVSVMFVLLLAASAWDRSWFGVVVWGFLVVFDFLHVLAGRLLREIEGELREASEGGRLP